VAFRKSGRWRGELVQGRVAAKGRAAELRCPPTPGRDLFGLEVAMDGSAPLWPSRAAARLFRASPNIAIAHRELADIIAAGKPACLQV